MGWDDGKIDPSQPARRECLWKKRLKPGLFNQGIKAYWFDDDEANKFQPPPKTLLRRSSVDCSGHANVEFLNAVLVKGTANYTGITASGCCAECTAHLDPASGEPDC